LYLSSHLIHVEVLFLSWGDVNANRGKFVRVTDQTREFKGASPSNFVLNEFYHRLSSRLYRLLLIVVDTFERYVRSLFPNFVGLAAGSTLQLVFLGLSEGFPLQSVSFFKAFVPFSLIVHPINLFIFNTLYVMAEESFHQEEKFD